MLFSCQENRIRGRITCPDGAAANAATRENTFLLQVQADCRFTDEYETEQRIRILGKTKYIIDYLFVIFYFSLHGFILFFYGLHLSCSIFLIILNPILTTILTSHVISTAGHTAFLTRYTLDKSRNGSTEHL